MDWAGHWGVDFKKKEESEGRKGSDSDLFFILQGVNAGSGTLPKGLVISNISEWRSFYNRRIIHFSFSLTNDVSLHKFTTNLTTIQFAIKLL